MTVPDLPVGSFIRPMTSFDLEPVLAIERASYDFPWTRGILADCLRVGYHCFVYEQDNNIRGYAFISTVLDEAHLLNICIAPEYQQQGYGRQFLQWLMDYVQKNNAKTMYLEVRISNTAAIELYQSMGFNEIGIRRNYYPARQGKEDAQLFACEFFQGD